ncbi:MAG: hypothetical protein ACYCSS_14705 [Sulfuriferula sp.]
MSAPHTGIWPEPVVTALAWILANRLPGASLSDLDVIRLRLDLDDGSKAEFSDHGGRGDVRVHRLRDDLEVWQTGPAPGKRHSGRFAVAQPCEPGAAFLATYEVRDHRVDEEAVVGEAIHRARVEIQDAAARLDRFLATKTGRLGEATIHAIDRMANALIQLLERAKAHQTQYRGLSNADFSRSFFPQPELAQMDDARLLERLRGLLPVANDQVDGTDPGAGPRIDYARDSVEQMRDVLLSRGHRFTEEEKNAMPFVKW